MLLAVGCARETYDVADLQVDITAPLPGAAATLRVCVTGAGVLDIGAGNGRAAFTGLPAGVPAEVRVTAWDADDAVLGGAGPVWVDAEAPWAEAAWRDGPEPACDDDGERVAAGEADWLLAVRFAEDR